jgi:hypothetical protein
VPSASQPPPSQEIPGHSSGGGLYLVGALILGASAIGLFVWKKSTPAAVTQQTVTATQTAPPPPAEPPRLFAPPPPPKLEELPDAGVDAGKAAPKGTGGPSSAGAGHGGPCGSPCKGESTGALSAALQGRAGSARACYQRALRTSEVSGSMTVSVQIGPSGQVCSASVTKDTIHSGEVTSCVLGRFRGQSFPPPSGGCIVANIPISFTIKQ